jgi:hypothetical protein
MRNRLTWRLSWPAEIRGGRPRGEAGEPAPVEPDRPKPFLTGGAAAPLEEDGA